MHAKGGTEGGKQKIDGQCAQNKEVVQPQKISEEGVAPVSLRNGESLSGSSQSMLYYITLRSTLTMPDAGLQAILCFSHAGFISVHA